MRSFPRFLKHVLLALAVLIAAFCTSEVGLRIHHVQQSITGNLREKPLARPCLLAYQHLPFDTRTSHWSADAGTEIEIASNSLGLRGAELTVPKPEGVYRIVCLGDEATLAPDIPEEETFCRLLVDLLQPQFGANVEIVNAGQPGHCPLLSLAWARMRLVGLQPDLVMLCCDVSDVADDRRCRPWAKFDETGLLLSVANPLVRDRPTDWLGALQEEFLLAKLVGDLLSERFARQAGFSEPHRRPSDDALDTAASGQPLAMLEQTWEPLAQLKTFCEQIPADFVVAVVPSSDAVRSASNMDASDAPDRISNIIRLLNEQAVQERIPMLDGSSAFARQGDDARLFLKSSGRLSAEGHQLFAEILSDVLSARAGDPPRAVTSPLPRGSVPVPPDSSTVPQQASPLPTLERRPRAADLLGGGSEPKK